MCIALCLEISLEYFDVFMFHKLFHRKHFRGMHIVIDRLDIPVIAYPIRCFRHLFMYVYGFKRHTNTRSPLSFLALFFLFFVKLFTYIRFMILFSSHYILSFLIKGLIFVICIMNCILISLFFFTFLCVILDVDTFQLE